MILEAVMKYMRGVIKSPSLLLLPLALIINLSWNLRAIHEFLVLWLFSYESGMRQVIHMTLLIEHYTQSTLNSIDNV